MSFPVHATYDIRLSENASIDFNVYYNQTDIVAIAKLLFAKYSMNYLGKNRPHHNTTSGLIYKSLLCFNRKFEGNWIIIAENTKMTLKATYSIAKNKRNRNLFL